MMMLIRNLRKYGENRDSQYSVVGYMVPITE